MSASLAQRLQGLVKQVLRSYAGAWLLWCDPRGEWAPLLGRVAAERARLEAKRAKALHKVEHSDGR